MTDETAPSNKSNEAVTAGALDSDEPESSNLTNFVKKTLRTLFSDNDSDNLRNQLEQAVELETGQSDSFSNQERVMIANILRFGSLRVEDVMVPRADIEAIEETASLKELLTHFETIGHSRIPVYRETLDDPTGMVHVKDLLCWIAENGDAPNSSKQATVDLKVISGGRETKEEIKSPALLKEVDQFRLTAKDFMVQIKNANILRDVLYVPPSMPVVNLLLRMQSTRVHLALVVDEYGGTDGLVSIEDLVEEVVGEIEDEHDDHNDRLMSGRLETGLTASARTPIEDLEEKINIDLFQHEERDDDIDTLGGFVFSLVGRVPVRGEIVTHPAGLEIEVLSADPRRIKTLKISIKK